MLYTAFLVCFNTVFLLIILETIAYVEMRFIFSCIRKFLSLFGLFDIISEIKIKWLIYNTKISYIMIYNIIYIIYNISYII